MNKEHVKGAGDKVIGKGEEVAGHVTGCTSIRHDYDIGVELSQPVDRNKALQALKFRPTER